MRKLVVGDIHGGLRGLRQVLEMVDPRAQDQFIFIGDYVDGWSESFETIAFLMEFAKKYSCVFIRGNHDELLFDYLSNGKARPMWLQHGGQASLESYRGKADSLISQHRRFLESLTNYHIDETNRLFLHAGFTNLHGPAHEYYPNMVYWDRTLWEMVCGLDPSIPKDSPLYPKRLLHFQEIYIGHTPVTRIGHSEPVNFANVWNVDTGAAFKGRISVLDAVSKQLWQSEELWRLYPDENGRN